MKKLRRDENYTEKKVLNAHIRRHSAASIRERKILYRLDPNIAQYSIRKRNRI